MMKRGNNGLQRGMTLLELTVVLLVLIALAGLVMPYVGGIGSTAMCQTTDATMQTVKEAIMGGKGGAGFYGDMLGKYPKATKSTTADYSLTHLFSAPTDASWGSMVSYNAKTGVGWRGPYLMSGTTLSVPTGSHFITAAYAHAQDNGQSGVNDAWGRPLVLQVPNQTSCDNLTGRTGTKVGECVRLVSAGPGSGLGVSDADIDTPIDDDSSTASTIEARRSNDDRMLYLRIPMPAEDANTPCDQS